VSDLRIFVSYSHRDPEYLGADSLLGFLNGLERDENVEFWTDQSLEAGMAWDETIQERLRTSDIALVLVSQSFLDSAYCNNVEISTFLDRCRRDGMIVFPVILSPCEWERHEWLTSRQFIPTGGETLEEHYAEPGKRKRLFLKIRQELRSAIARVREQRAAASQPAASSARTVVERKPITAVYVELVPTEIDGKALDGEDLPEILHELMPEFQEVCRQVFEGFEGSLAQMEGRGVIAFFGHPIAHEDDSRRAVRAGLALIERIGKLSEHFQQELNVRLTVRIGVHSGVVICESGDVTSDALRQTETSMVAGRIQEHASPNSVVVSATTYALIDEFFETESSGTIAVPSIAQPLAIHHIVKDTGYDSRLQAAQARGLAPLIGRDNELELLLDRSRETRRGNGQIVLLRAEAGVGKSRLLAEMRNRLAAEPHQWIECRCSSYHQNSAFYPLIGSLELWLGIERGNDAPTKLEKLESALGKFSSPYDEIVPPIATLLSIPYEPRYPKLQGSPREQKDLMLQAMAQLALENAMQSPVVFVFEDLHWVDPSTIEFIELLIEQAATAAILVLCTFRPEYAAPAAWLNLSYVSQISLDRLGRAEAEEMVQQLTGGKRLPEEVLEEIYRKTEGFPLFIEDLTRMVLESELLIEKDDHYELSGPFRSLAIPATLQETLMARLARLATAKPVAQLGAAIGREFVFEMLLAIGEFDDKTLTEELNRLVQAGLLYKRGLLSRAKYVFKHALVQEALHQSLVKKQRRQYHKLIADVLEEKFRDVVETQPELLAHHYNEAGATAKAIDYWERAAQRALNRSANVEALSHTRRALTELPRLSMASGNERELRLRMIEGPALLALRGWASPELGACYARAMELCKSLGKNTRMFSSIRGMWTNHMVAARLAEALLFAQELYAMATASSDEDFLLEAHGALCDTYFWMGRPVESRENARIGFETYDVERHHQTHSIDYGEDPATMFYTYSALSLYLTGRTAESFEFTHAAIAMFEKFSHMHSRAFLICGVAWNYLQARDAPNVAIYADMLVDISTANSFGAWLPLGKAMKGWAMAAMGDLDTGLAQMEQGRQEWHAIGAGVKACFYPSLMADLCCRAGRLDQARHWVQAGLDAAARCDDRYYYSELHRVRGDIFAKEENESEAIRAYETAHTIAVEQGARLLDLRATVGLAALHLGADRAGQAAAVLAPLRDVWESAANTFDGAEAAALASLLGERVTA
jgi:class 3 adenylate cyclase